MSEGVLIVGGGLAGAAVGLELTRRGESVVLVDRETPGSRATGASAGMLSAQYEAGGPGETFRFAVACRRLQPGFIGRLEELAELDLGYRADGLLLANRTEEEHREASRTVAWQRDAGLEARLLEPGEARELEPDLSGEPRSWAWFPEEAQVDTQRVSRALPAALAAAGVQTVTGVAVERLVTGEGRVEGVGLEDGRSLEAPRVVIAAGAWSGRIEGLPRRLPVQPVRGQMLRLPPGSARAGRLLALHDGRYVVPRSDGSLLAGSTMERRAGFEATVTREGEARILEGAALLLPGLEEARPSERWAGLRPVTPDGLPVLGPDPGVEGLFYATGFGRNGILYSAGAGRVLADLLLGPEAERAAEPGLAWEPFGVERFAPA